MSLNTQRYQVSLQIDGETLISTQDATVDAAISQMLVLPPSLETIARFKDRIPLPQSAVSRAPTTLNFSGLLDAVLEDRPTSEIEQQFPQETRLSGMLLRESLEHAFYSDQSSIRLCINGCTSTQPLIYRGTISRELPMGLFLWAMPLPMIYPAFWVTEMRNGGLSAKVHNYLDSKPGNFIAGGYFLYPTDRIKARSTTDLIEVAAFLHWGLTDQEVIDLKQYCDQAL